MKQIFYQPPNQVSIELVSEMHLQCYDFGPFDTPIEELLEDYSQASGEQQCRIAQSIRQQCEFYADTVGYNEDIASLISFDNLTNDIERMLLQAIQQ